MQTVFLKSGEIFYDMEPTVVTTILGSCVSVCLYSKSKKVGGINHFALPTNERSLKHGPHSIECLRNEMMSFYGASDLVAKVFGGSDMLSFHDRIGTKNVKIALEVLASFHIPVVSYSTGGNLGYKIEFFTHTGLVHVKHSSHNVIPAV